MALEVPLPEWEPKPENHGLGQWLFFGGEFLQRGYKCLSEKFRNSFLLSKFEKEASRKEKTAKISKPQKLGKKNKKKKKTLVYITNEKPISFLPLDSEVVETQDFTSMVPG